MKDKGKREDLDFEIAFYERLLEGKPNFPEALICLGDAYTARGLYQKGLLVDKKLAKLKPHDPIVYYNLACSYSLLNLTGQAWRALKKAVSLGYRDFDYMNKDSDLANLRRDPRYKKLVANQMKPRLTERSERKSAG